MTEGDRASLGWETGCLLLIAAAVLIPFIGWWSILLVLAALWLVRKERPTGPN